MTLVESLTFSFLVW